MATQLKYSIGCGCCPNIARVAKRVVRAWLIIARSSLPLLFLLLLAINKSQLKCNPFFCRGVDIQTINQLWLALQPGLQSGCKLCHKVVSRSHPPPTGKRERLRGREREADRQTCLLFGHALFLHATIVAVACCMLYVGLDQVAVTVVKRDFSIVVVAVVAFFVGSLHTSNYKTTRCEAR